MADQAKQIQVTLALLKEKINAKAAYGVEDKLKHIANYAVVVSPEDTGAYVESHTIGLAGFSGGRMRKSEARHKVKANGASKEKARALLHEDISKLDIPKLLEQGKARFTIRNRAPHAVDVEDKHGYSVFAKIKNRFT